MKDHFDADEAAREATGRFSAGPQIGYFLLAVRGCLLDVTCFTARRTGS